jgi:hypothetical protein
LVREIRTEKSNRDTYLQDAEGKHRKKYQQLTQLLDQYKQQVGKFQSLTETNAKYIE